MIFLLFQANCKMLYRCPHLLVLFTQQNVLPWAIHSSPIPSGWTQELVENNTSSVHSIQLGCSSLKVASFSNICRYSRSSPATKSHAPRFTHQPSFSTLNCLAISLVFHHYKYMFGQFPLFRCRQSSGTRTLFIHQTPTLLFAPLLSNVVYLTTLKNTARALFLQRAHISDCSRFRRQRSTLFMYIFSDTFLNISV